MLIDLIRIGMRVGLMRSLVCESELGWLRVEFEIPMVKLQRAHGGCLGIERR
jgi:hypothetical protein